MIDQNKLAETGEEFAEQLLNLSNAIDGEVGQVITNAAFKVLCKIIMRSPVLTGTYRANNMLAVGAEPSTTQEIFPEQAKNISEQDAINRFSDFKWKVKDGDIWFYNNVSYAEEIENGHSKVKAPEGVYVVSLNEFTHALREELENMDIIEP